MLVVDTEDLDFVHDNAAQTEIVGRMKNAIRGDAHQLAFPDMTPAAEPEAEERGASAAGFPASTQAQGS